MRTVNGGAAILRAGPAGLTQVAELVSDPVICPRAATRASGSGLVAFAVLREEQGKDAERVVQAAVRDPGGAWSPVTDALPAPDQANGNSLAVAVSDAGEGLIAVALKPGRLEIRVARRSPGAAFGASQKLFAAATGSSTEPSVQAGMSASGEAVVAWSFLSRARTTRELWAAVAAPGAAFGAPVRIGELQLGTPFSLAVGDGGHGLLAFAAGGEVRVAERAPGAAFSPTVVVGRSSDLRAILPTAAVDAAGGALIAWQRASDSALDAVVRSRPGPFGAPVTLSRPTRIAYPAGLTEFFEAFSPANVEGEHNSSDGGDFEARHPRAVIAGGRALLAWAAPLGRDGVWSLPPRSATLALAGGAPEIRVHGAGIREAELVTPLLADGGVPAVAWIDENDEEEDARLHLALEGAAETAGTAPRVQVRAVSGRVLGPRQALVLRVTCSAACDVRAQAGAGLGGANEAISLSRAGSGRIRLEPGLRPLATLRGGPVRVHVRAAAPDGRAATVSTLTLQLRRRPGPPRPRVLDAVARRDGDDVVVSWSTDRDADRDDMFVFSADPLGLGEARGGPRRFRARMRDVRRARTATIWVAGSSIVGSRRTTVRVRR